jgi:hypothetical protein
LGELTAELDVHAQIDGQRVYAAVMVILTNSVYTTSSGATWRANAFITRIGCACRHARISWGKSSPFTSIASLGARVLSMWMTIPCESGLVSGVVVYGPEPLEKPADGNLVVCCSQPIRDIVIDL